MNDLRRWWWVPVLGALLCGGITALLVTNWVAGRVEDGAVAALEAAGLDTGVDYVGVDGLNGIGRDGVNVVLEGPAADEAAAVEAVAARSEVDQVVFRVVERDATDGVGGDDGEPDGDALDDAAVSAADEAGVGGEQTEAAADPASMAVAAIVGPDGIILSGQVPDEAARDALVMAAVAQYGEETVTDELEIAATAVAADGGTLTVSGEASTEAERAELIDRATAVAVAGGLDLVDGVTVRSVERSLNDLFELDPIEFDAARATIRDGSTPTLDAAAELINANPGAGRLLVVGHTDSDGSSRTNQALSEARAAAVVDYLVTTGNVDAERLEAEGRGESELLVDPEITPEDRQRNRRIEWELLS
jgi:outer membrane protein OmpA-like peptidoglycan-associated protein